MQCRSDRLILEIFLTGTRDRDKPWACHRYAVDATASKDTVSTGNSFSRRSSRAWARAKNSPVSVMNRFRNDGFEFAGLALGLCYNIFIDIKQPVIKSARTN